MIRGIIPKQLRYCLVSSRFERICSNSNTTMTTIIAEDQTDLIKKLSGLIEEASNEAIKENNTFKIGVSGGSLVSFLASGLPTVKTDFSKWRIFFCDERIVPFDDPESTFGVYKKQLLGKIEGLTEEQFVKIKPGTPPTNESERQRRLSTTTAEEAARDYAQQMARHFPPNTKLPRFDMLLLGMGPDGHTCSLFPGHELLEETSAWVAPIADSPKPPPARVTLTFPVINNAKRCVFALAGEGKAEMVKRILVDKEDLPATRVQPTSGQLYWIIDKAAAKYISS